jgi:hypothetical protein
MRHVVGVGKPRRLQGALLGALAAVGGVCAALFDLLDVYRGHAQPVVVSSVSRYVWPTAIIGSR